METQTSGRQPMSEDEIRRFVREEIANQARFALDILERSGPPGLLMERSEILPRLDTPLHFVATHLRPPRAQDA